MQTVSIHKYGISFDEYSKGFLQAPLILAALAVFSAADKFAEMGMSS